MSARSAFALSVVFVVALLFTTGPALVQAQEPLGTTFTYQGQLKDDGAPVVEDVDLRFTLYDTPSSETPLTETLQYDLIDVSEGYFTVEITFPEEGLFKGEARYLDIEVRLPAGSGEFTPLEPRQRLAPTPYALALPGLWTEQTGASPNIIGGYSGNMVSPGVIGATICGGGTVWDDTLQTAAPNVIYGDHGVVCGGVGNSAGSPTPPDGRPGTRGGHKSVCVGGKNNHANGDYSAILGGQDNTADYYYDTVVAGHNNYTNAYGGTIGGGMYHEIYDDYGTIPGGFDCTVNGEVGFAAGWKATAAHDGSFVWSDYHNPSGSYDYGSSRANHFAVCAYGGARFDIEDDQYVNMRYYNNKLISTSANGAYLHMDGNWYHSSSKTMKENFTSVDGDEVLTKLTRLPITTWNYKNDEAGARHIGPMAEDFYDLFGVGGDREMMADIDPSGVALAGVQELHRRNEEQAAEITLLRDRIEDFERRLNELTGNAATRTRPSDAGPVREAATSGREAAGE